MSDLQCAATVLLVRHGDSISDEGRSEVADLARRLADRRVAHVYAGAGQQHAETGPLLAEALGVGVTIRPDLAVADSEAGVALQPVLDEVADLHRGETVVVVASGDLIRLGLPPLCAALSARWVDQRPLASCAVVEVAGDADGWVCHSWSGALPG